MLDAYDSIFPLRKSTPNYRRNNLRLACARSSSVQTVAPVDLLRRCSAIGISKCRNCSVPRIVHVSSVFHVRVKASAYFGFYLVATETPMYSGACILPSSAGGMDPIACTGLAQHSRRPRPSVGHTRFFGFLSPATSTSSLSLFFQTCGVLPPFPMSCGYTFRWQMHLLLETTHWLPVQRLPAQCSPCFYYCTSLCIV